MSDYSYGLIDFSQISSQKLVKKKNHIGIENPDASRQLLQTISEYCKVTGLNISIQKLIAFLYK